MRGQSIRTCSTWVIELVATKAARIAGSWRISRRTSEPAGDIVEVAVRAEHGHHVGLLLPAPGLLAYVRRVAEDETLLSIGEQLAPVASERVRVRDCRRVGEREADQVDAEGFTECLVLKVVHQVHRRLGDADRELLHLDAGELTEPTVSQVVEQGRQLHVVGMEPQQHISFETTNLSGGTTAPARGSGWRRRTRIPVASVVAGVEHDPMSLVEQHLSPRQSRAQRLRPTEWWSSRLILGVSRRGSSPATC